MNKPITHDQTVSNLFSHDQTIHLWPIQVQNVQVWNVQVWNVQWKHSPVTESLIYDKAIYSWLNFDMWPNCVQKF